MRAVFGVMAGIGLVSHEMGERGRQHREIDVDRDLRLEPAQVVVEATPGLVGHQLEGDALAIGQTEQGPGPVPEVLGERGDRRLEVLDGHRLRLAPGHVALGERTGSGHRLLEPTVRRLELVQFESPRAHAVAGFDLVGVADLLTGELTGAREQADRLRMQEVAPGGVRAGVRSHLEPRRARRTLAIGVTERLAGVDRREQPARLGHEVFWRHDRGRGDAVRDGSRPVVGVDESFDVPVHRPAEREVALDYPRRHGRAQPIRERRNSSVRCQASSDASAS